MQRTVRTTKAEFSKLKLEQVDKILCLKNLGAHISARPDELQAVKPIVEFDMVDRRFIEQGDALAGLESRPNLMELTPGEFETLVVGADAKLTQGADFYGPIAKVRNPLIGNRLRTLQVGQRIPAPWANFVSVPTLCRSPRIGPLSFTKHFSLSFRGVKELMADRAIVVRPTSRHSQKTEK